MNGDLSDAAPFDTVEAVC